MTSLNDQVRANEFDQWVGVLQTKKACTLGVGSSILDVGCGIGQFTPLFKNRFDRVVGLDPSEKYLKHARKHTKGVEYINGWGETFELEERFSTISMNMLLEHVDDPVLLLKNCKKHLLPGGRILAQVPNANSVARRLGVIMGIIDSIDHISEKERKLYGHQRTYTMKTLKKDVRKAGLKVVEAGGLLYKPLPNDMLLDICMEHDAKWIVGFMDALLEFGEDRPEDCANLYICASA